MAKHLAKLFKEKSKKDVFANPKATLKMYKEADRVKNILSANPDTFAQVEGLMDDVDFKVFFLITDFEISKSSLKLDLFFSIRLK